MKRTIALAVISILGLSICGTREAAQDITPQVTTAFRFVAWGDSRGSSGVNSSELSALSNQINGLSTKPVLTLFDGDLCDKWSNCSWPSANSLSASWTSALDGGSNNGMYAITFPFRGNHDDSASGWDFYFNGHAQATVTAIGGSSFSYYSSDGPNRTYSFDYGNSHFVGIDLPGGEFSTITTGQTNWLDSDLAAAESRGVTHSFIMGHGPIWPINQHPDSAPGSLITVMNKHQSISATFHGHEHVMGYAHIDSSRISGVTHPWEEFVSGGAGAPLYSCSSGLSDFCTSSYGFATVDVNGSSFTVTLYYGNQNRTWSFTKSGGGGGGSVTLSPTSVSFGNVTVGTTSSAQSLTLTNGTSSAVNVSISLTQTNSDFSETNNCPSSLPATAGSNSCTISVTFTPSVAASETATLNTGSGLPTASLSGTGVSSSGGSPTVTLSATSLNFGRILVGQKSAPQTVQVATTGSPTLTSITLPTAPFAATSSGCTSTLPQSGCSFSVTFTPTKNGRQTGTLTMTDSAGTQTVSLVGWGSKH